jgi:hypothetical protein
MDDLIAHLSARAREAAEKKRPAPTPDVLAVLCDRIASGMSLTRVCQSTDMPAKSVVYRQMRNDPAFLEQYQIAQEQRTDALFEDALEIADDGSSDFIETKWGPKLDVEHVNRSKLRVETRLKMASKLNPKKYGEKIDVSGSIAVPVRFIIEGGPQTIDVKARQIPDTGGAKEDV